MPSLHTLSIADMRVLCVVADAGSISAASEIIGYSQSGISRRIAAIERAAGAELVERLPRGVRLTEAGERLRARAREVVATADRAQQELAAGRHRRPPVRIGAFSTANAALIPLAARRMALVEPDVPLTVREHRSTTLLGWVVAGRVDLAVVSDYPTALPAAGVELQPLLEDPLLVALPADHRLARRSFGLADLASEAWIEGDATETVVLRDAARRAGFEPRIAHRVRDWNTKLAFVAAGLGVALVPGLAATSRRGDVVLSAAGGALPVRRVSVATASAPVDGTPAATLVSVLPAIVRELGLG
jgi:DNA-binding transcriptional LysR family regulator